VHFDADADEAVLTVERDTVRRLRLGRLHGVALGTTRDSLAFDARGLGHGAANLRITLERRTEAETLVVSRLGRVRAPAW